MFENYRKLAGMDETGTDNQFVATFYNRYKKDLSEKNKALVEFLKDHIPKSVTVKLDVPALEQPEDAATTAR